MSILEIKLKFIVKFFDGVCILTGSYILVGTNILIFLHVDAALKKQKKKLKKLTSGLQAIIQ